MSGSDVRSARIPPCLPSCTAGSSPVWKKRKAEQEVFPAHQLKYIKFTV